MANIITWPAPAGETASPDWTVEADGVPLFLYQARVRAEILQNEGLWTHRPDCQGERAAFAIFDLARKVSVSIRPTRPFRTAQVLPARFGIVPEIAGGTIRFSLDTAQHLTILLDGDDRQALHLFIGRPETDVPRPDDPNVVYFGPGVHEIDTIELRSGQTLYLAGGAVVKARLRPGEQGTFSDKWKVTFFSGVVFDVRKVSGVRICGRGILDGSLVPHPGRNLIAVNESSDVRLEGITLRDSPNWNVLIRKSHGVRVDGLRLVSGRLNSDGINSVNSRDVRIRNCFVRNHDDSIVAKTTEPDLPTEDITVEDCQLWSDWGYSLGATYETRAAIRRLLFRCCDVLYARHWCLGIHVSDSATVEDVIFRDIGIADLSAASPPDSARAALTPEPKLLRLVITQDCWGHDPERGRIRNVTLDGVTVQGRSLPPSEMIGLDAEHDIRGVTFRNVRLAAQAPVADAVALRLQANEHVRDLHFVNG